MGYTTYQLLSKVVIGVSITPEELRQIHSEREALFWGEYEDLCVYGTRGYHRSVYSSVFRSEYTPSCTYDEVDNTPSDESYTEFIIGMNLNYGTEADSEGAIFVASSRMNFNEFMTKCSAAQTRLIEIIGEGYSERIETINVCLNSEYKED